MPELSTEKLLDKVSQELRHYMLSKNITNPLFIGIRTGGVWVAEKIQQILKNTDKLGILDITFYRDDFSRAGIHPAVKPSQIPLSVNDRHIILVDDVLHTGRTVRAALNEIFDYGRPASVNFVTLVERNGRELPIQADVVGESIVLDPSQHIKLSGPNPLKLEVVKT